MTLGAKAKPPEKPLVVAKPVPRKHASKTNPDQSEFLKRFL